MKNLFFSILAIVSVAFACKCRMPTNEAAFCGADLVSHVKIISKENITDDFGSIHYTVEHVETFKAPTCSPLSCDIYTSGSSASCGIDDLLIGKDYLVAGYVGEDKKQHIGSCGQFQDGRDWSTVPATLKKQLKAGFKCPATTKAP